MLPVTQHPHQPGGPGEKRIAGQVRAAPEQVVASPRALLLPCGCQLPTAQPQGASGQLQTPQPAVVIPPAMAHRQVDLQHAWIGGQAQHLPAIVQIAGQHAPQARGRQAAKAVSHGLQQGHQGMAQQGRQKQIPLAFL